MATFKKISDLEAISIVSNGIFYFPAWKHHYNPSTEVYCDYCNKSNLLSSIGHRNMDLCLECVEILTINIKKNNIQCNNITLPTDNIGNAPNNISPIPNIIINPNNQENKYPETTFNNNKIIELKSNETLTIISGNVNIIGSNVNLTNASNNIHNNTLQNQFIPNNNVPNHTISNQFLPTTNFWNQKQENNKTNQNNFTIPTIPTNTFGFNYLPTTNQFEKK